MRFVRGTWAVLAVALLAGACEKSKIEETITKVVEDDDTRGAFIETALKTAPQILDKHTKSWFAPSFTEYTQPSTGDTTTQNEDALYFFLHFSCHSSDGSFNICPKYGIEVTDFATSPYGGQSGQLMGILALFGTKYHDSFGLGGCTSGGLVHKPKILGDARYVIGNAPGDFADLLTCTAVMRDPGSSDPTYQTHSTDGTIEAFIVTQPKSQNGAYVFQGYTRKVDGKIAFFAFNQTQYQPKDVGCCQERTFLIGNVETRRFIFKRGTAADKGIVAFGTGGVDLGGVVFEGHYAASVTQWADHTLFCVNNHSGEIEPDGTNCADETVSGFFAGTKTWADVTAYMGFTADDQKYLQGWSAYLGDGAFLTTSQIPSAADQFPTEITFASFAR